MDSARLPRITRVPTIGASSITGLSLRPPTSPRRVPIPATDNPMRIPGIAAWEADWRRCEKGPLSQCAMKVFEPRYEAPTSKVKMYKTPVIVPRSMDSSRKKVAKYVHALARIDAK